MMCKPCSFYAFEMLYWTGIREGELLALTPEDFDFDKGTVRINKSYQRMNRRDVITDPKTPNSALYWRFQYGSYALWIYRLFCQHLLRNAFCLPDSADALSDLIIIHNPTAHKRFYS